MKKEDQKKKQTGCHRTGARLGVGQRAGLQRQVARVEPQQCRENPQGDATKRSVGAQGQCLSRNTDSL